MLGTKFICGIPAFYQHIQRTAKWQWLPEYYGIQLDPSVSGGKYKSACHLDMISSFLMNQLPSSSCHIPSLSYSFQAPSQMYPCEKAGVAITPPGVAITHQHNVTASKLQTGSSHVIMVFFHNRSAVIAQLIRNYCPKKQSRVDTTCWSLN